MTIENLRELKKAEPFQPFVIHLTDGRKFDVPAENYFSPSPNPGGQMFIVWTDRDKAFHFFDLSMIADIEMKSLKKRRKRRAS